MSPQPDAAEPQPVRPVDLVELLGIPFTDEQLAAITAPLRPTLVVAGAGSGKTAVMAARVVWLVGSGQCRPDEVLGLTFTNKAAAELAARVRAALARLPVPPGGPDGDAGEPTVSTYHAYAGRLLSEHALRLGVEPGARLLADATRFQLAQRVVRRARGPFPALARALATTVADVITLDGELSEHLVEPTDVRRYDARLLADIASGGTSHADVRKAAEIARARADLLTLVEEFRRAKRAADVVDFADQVALGARLAETFPEVGALERSRFRVVLLDEYQDTSVAQRRLLVGLFGGHPVTAVGDPCQAIYGWRGASVGNLDGFPHHFADAAGPAARRQLRVNMRSGGRLLRLANRLADPLRTAHPSVVELLPRDGAALAGDTRCGVFDTWADEVAWVADRIADAIAAGTPPGECAVLARARSSFPDLYDALTSRGIPVEVVGLGGLLELPEIVDLVALLEVLDDPTANVAMLRVLTGVRWRIGPRDLAALGRLAARLTAPTGGRGEAHDKEDHEAALDRAVSGRDPAELVALSDAVDEVARRARAGADGLAEFSGEAARRLTALAGELRQLRRHAGEPLLELVHRVLDTTGLGVELSASPGAVAAGRAQALDAFLDHVARFVGLDGEASLPAFLGYLRTAQEYDDGPEQEPGARSGRDAVQLMTVHKAKGLEWEVVAVPALAKGVFPPGKSRSSWLTAAHVVPHPLRGDAADLPACPQWSKGGIDAVKDELRELAEREERRLAYVAVTRARTTLLASAHWWGPTQKRPRGPSPYLEQIRAHCVAGHGVVDFWAEQPPDGMDNPRLGERLDVPYPLPLATEGYAERQRAAGWVREELDRIAAGRPSDGYAGLDMVAATTVAGWDADLEALLREAHADEAGRRSVALPTSLSASQLVRLAADPDGLARELARPMPRRPAPHARRGTAFHAWVETLFGPRPLLAPDELPGAGDADTVDTDLAALQQAFRATPYATREPLHLEAPFELVLGGRVIRGRIDAIYGFADGSFEVVDWKTGREAADPLQLAIYRVAWAELAGVPVDQVRAAFVYVRDGRTVHHDDLPDRAALTALLTLRPGPALNQPGSR